SRAGHSARRSRLAQIRGRPCRARTTSRRSVSVMVVAGMRWSARFRSSLKKSKKHARLCERSWLSYQGRANKVYGRSAFIRVYPRLNTLTHLSLCGECSFTTTRTHLNINHRSQPPDRNGDRARRAYLRLPAGRKPARDQERCVARDAVPHLERRSKRRTRTARHRFRSKLREQ